MRRIRRRHAVLALAILIALPLSSNSPEVATANQVSERGESALCVAGIRPDAASLIMSFVGYRRVAFGFPWEHISTIGFRNGRNNSLPLIWGLPPSGPPLPIPLAVQTIDVSVNNNSFVPATIHISVGDTVRWTWQGSGHTVTSGGCLAVGEEEEQCAADNKFCSPSNVNCGASPPLGPGTVYSHQFNSAGTFPYFCLVHLSLMKGTVIVEASAAPTIQLGAPTYSVSEAAGSVTVAVSRSGPTTGAATVDYATSDTAALNNCNVINGVASSRCDYPTSVGTIRFAAGETSKNVSIPIVDDSYAEGNENFTIALNNPAGGSLGTPSSATVTINDNETSNGPNPIDGIAFFVRQQYLDFLGREPDPAGYADWQALMNGCAPGDTTCDRVHVSSSFFRSPEFQDRGYFVYRFYPVAFGQKPTYVEFIPDFAKVSGFLTDAELEAAKAAFVNDFITRTEFRNKYDGTSNTQYVDMLLANAGITHSAREFWIAALGNGTRTRAQVLREISESGEVYNKYFNQAFVVMQYFGYLRREPDGFYLAWIAVLDSSNDYRGMIIGFINSTEYRARFGP